MFNNIENTGERIEIGKHVLYMENDILFSIANGNYHEEDTLGIVEAILKILKARSTLSILVDMNKIGKVTPEARKISTELMSHEKINKIAFVGMNLVARVVSEFIMQFSGNKRCRFFKETGEALKWLSA